MQTQVYILFAVKAGGKSSNCFGAGHHPRQHRSKNKVTSLVDTDYGQNQFFYDAAEGLVSSIILLIAEYLPPDHKARWFAKAALNSAEQAMVSVLSTVLSRLNAFLDSGMEQILCFDTAIDAEKFCNEKSALFVVLPEEDLTKYFMVSLMIQQLYREILAVADDLKSIPKGSFVVMKTGTHPMRTRLRLFLDWGIRFGKPYTVEEKAHRKVVYAEEPLKRRSHVRT